MSLSLLAYNGCHWGGCGLHFATSYDLIAHIESQHIPAEEARRRGDDGTVRTTNGPISMVCKLFPVAYNPQPCHPEPVKLSFNHYKKRTQPTGHVLPPSSMLYSGVRGDVSVKTDEDDYSEDLEEAEAGDTRFVCQVEGCDKRYKNTAGLRLHCRQAHSAVPPPPSSCVTREDVSGAVVTAEGRAGVLPGGGPVTPSKTRFKCQFCSKRYKTMAGLNNHVSQSHSKPKEMTPGGGGESGGGTPQWSGGDAASPATPAGDSGASRESVTPVSIHSQMQQHQSQPTHFPVQVHVSHSASSPQLHSVGGGQGHSLHYQMGQPQPTTGQLLQQQYMQQRRAAAEHRVASQSRQFDHSVDHQPRYAPPPQQ